MPYVEDGSGSGGYAKEMSSGYKEAEVRISLKLPLSLRLFQTSFHTVLDQLKLINCED